MTDPKLAAEEADREYNRDAEDCGLAREHCDATCRNPGEGALPPDGGTQGDQVRSGVQMGRPH
ncbi:MAG: hypothetical protein HYZ28_03820 [Myxococcales bacterium]|nr:hypothetical protein [Myxococcales bacterium]